jgi:hypothetical protein
MDVIKDKVNKGHKTNHMHILEYLKPVSIIYNAFQKKVKSVHNSHNIGGRKLKIYLLKLNKVKQEKQLL